MSSMRLSHMLRMSHRSHRSHGLSGLHAWYSLRFIGAFLLLFLTAFSAQVYAEVEHDLIIERGLFIESSPGALTIQQAVTQDYQPFGVVLNRGFVPTIRWIRLQVQAPAKGAEQVILRVGPHYIGDIQLFEQIDGVWSHRTAGDRFPAGANTCADNLYCFPITVRAGVENYFYLRVETINGFFLTTRVMSPQDLTKLIVGQQQIFGLETGVILAIAMWALILYVRTRHKLLGIFFLSEVVTLLFALATSGQLAELFFEKHIWLDNLTFNILYILRLILSILVTQEFLRRYEPPQWYGYYVKVVVGVLCLQFVALTLGHLTSLALNFNFLLISSMPVILLVALPWCHQMPTTHRRLIALCALLMAGLLWIDVLPLLGWVRPDLVTSPGNWGGLIVAFAMSVMVVSDITHRRVIYDREMQELQFMRARNLVETEQIKERSMLIDMLTHELKNPLATMRMAAGSLRRSLQKQPPGQPLDTADSTDRIDSMIQAINNMNTVIERCVQVDQLDQKGFAPKFEEFNVNEMVQSMLASLSESERIDLKMQSTPIMLRSDPNLFAIVLANLLDNAIKYSQPESRIVLEVDTNQSASEYASRFMLRVSNTVGENNAPDPAELFSRYYRGAYAHDKSGTGLGLYLVKALCKILGGTIHFENKDHQVYFTVELRR